MTSIIGIKTNTGIEGIVIGSDTQEMHSDKDDNQIGKKDISKIISGQKWIISYAGNTDASAFYRFTRVLQGDKRYLKEGENPENIIRLAVENYLKFGKKYQGPHFRRLADTNSDIMKEFKDVEKLNNYVLGVYFDNKVNGLWYIDELGNLVEPRDHKNHDATDKEFDYVCIGSGGEDMEKYIEQAVFDGDINPQEISIGEAVKIVFSSLRKANKDPLTGFLKDVAIISKDSVERYGELIKDKLSKAEEEAEREIIFKYHV